MCDPASLGIGEIDSWGGVDKGINWGHRNMIFTIWNNARKNATLLGVFLVVSGIWWGAPGAWDVWFMVPWGGWNRHMRSGGYMYKLRPPHHDFYHLEQCLGKFGYVGSIWGHFRALIGVPEAPNGWLRLPWYKWEELLRRGGNRHEWSLPHLEFNHSEPYYIKNGCVGGIFGSFWALMGHQVPSDVWFRVPLGGWEEKS